MLLGYHGDQVVTEDTLTKVSDGVYTSALPMLPGTTRLFIAGVRRTIGSGDFTVALDQVTITLSAELTASITSSDILIADYEA